MWMRFYVVHAPYDVGEALLESPMLFPHGTVRSEDAPL